MARIRRFCLILIHVFAASPNLIPGVSAGRRQSESLEKICGSSHVGTVRLNSTGPGSVIEVRGTHERGLPDSFHCVVKFTTTSNTSRLAYSIQRLDIPHACKSYLKFWGANEKPESVSKFCDEIEDPLGQTGHVFRDNAFFLKMVTHRDDWGFDRIGFVITVTALRISAHKRCLRDEATCAEGDSCIYHKLSCDGVNNCGDGSDEKCLSSVLTLVFIIVGAIVIAGLIGVFICYTRRTRSLKPYDISRATSTQSVQSDSLPFWHSTGYVLSSFISVGRRFDNKTRRTAEGSPFLPPRCLSKQGEQEDFSDIPSRDTTAEASKSLEGIDGYNKRRPKQPIESSVNLKARNLRRESFPPTRRPQKELAIINAVDIQDLKNLSRKESENKRNVLLSK